MYTPPQTTNLAPTVLHEEHSDASDCGTLCFPPKGTSTVAKNTNKAVKEPSMIPEETTIGIGKQLNAKGTVVSDIMIERIENHILYLNGTKGFPNKKAQDEEQETFIETIGSSLKMADSSREAISK